MQSPIKTIDHLSIKDEKKRTLLHLPLLKILMELTVVIKFYCNDSQPESPVLNSIQYAWWPQQLEMYSSVCLVIEFPKLFRFQDKTELVSRDGDFLWPLTSRGHFFSKWANSKGQLILKWFLGSSISSKKRMNEFVFTSMRHVFVCFLEEIHDPKKPFRN